MRHYFRHAAISHERRFQFLVFTFSFHAIEAFFDFDASSPPGCRYAADDIFTTFS